MRLVLRSLTARHPAARPGTPPALQPLDLDIAAGEQVAVIGASGAGKTTLLQVLALAMAPSEGHIEFESQDPWALPRSALQRLRGRLFLAPQTPPLPPRQRVVTAVLAGRLPALGAWASLREWLHPTDLEAARAALQRFDLADKLFERVDRLSGGERQRVGLARGLLAPARLWLVDEPLSALDPARSKLALETLLAVGRERGLTLVATLHQVEMALAHFPRILGLREGRVQFDLPAAEVTREHLAHLYAQHEDEWHGIALPARDASDPAPAALPVAAHCR